MTHTVHPYAHRIGILRDWKSRWFSEGDDYKKSLKADILLREFLEEKLRTFHVSSIEMERSKDRLTIIIMTSRPGLVIGREGEGVTQLKKDIDRFMSRKNIRDDKEIRIDVQEVRSPESDAAIVGQMVREGLERRLPYRRVLKQTVEKVMANRDTKGVRIALAGRLGGAEMSRREEYKKGQIPLQTLRADIDFAQEIARLPYGVIGVKVWIYRGEVFE